MRPTPEDLKILTEVWTKKTNELAVQIDETSKEIQDHAYYLGREQGHREERERIRGIWVAHHSHHDCAACDAIDNAINKPNA